MINPASQIAADPLPLNAAFEEQFFTPPGNIPWICTYRSALRIWPDAPDHKNGTILHWLWDQNIITPDRSRAETAHQAGSDAYAIAHILSALLDHASVA